MPYCYLLVDSKLTMRWEVDLLLTRFRRVVVDSKRRSIDKVYIAPHY